jgi:hypothetical protein
VAWDETGAAYTLVAPPRRAGPLLVCSNAFHPGTLPTASPPASWRARADGSASAAGHASGVSKGGKGKEAQHPPGGTGGLPLALVDLSVNPPVVYLLDSEINSIYVIQTAGVIPNLTIQSAVTITRDATLLDEPFGILVVT